MLTAALTSNLSARPMPSSTDNAALSTHAPTSSRSEAPLHIRIVPHLDSQRSLVFDIIERDIAQGEVLKIGRFTDKCMSLTRITFKSKVVSRGHAEIWTENNKFYIRDIKSSSGTFLNHVRLSAPNQASRPCELKDGDIVQLGVDYHGGSQEIYRCVRMRIELNRHHMNNRMTYSLNTFQTLRNLTTPPNNISVLDDAMHQEEANRTQLHIEECCICLYAIAPFQALFVAPCSHTFHYKCLRPLLVNYPGFLCPLCRNYADLDASVAVETADVLRMLQESKAAGASAEMKKDVTNDENRDPELSAKDDERCVDRPNSLGPRPISASHQTIPSPDDPNNIPSHHD